MKSVTRAPTGSAPDFYEMRMGEMLRSTRRLVARFARRLQGRQPSPPSRWTRDDPRYAAFSIGEWTYGHPDVFWAQEGLSTLRIGRFCSIADGATIMLGGNHRVDWITTYPFSVLSPGARNYAGHPQTKGDVVIGNDVWIAREALILSGVTIGNGAVVAARSVVSRSVPPYAVVAGNPARLVRFRFPEDQVRELERIAWWDWPMSRIEEAWPLLLSPNISEFLRRYSSA